MKNKNKQNMISAVLYCFTTTDPEEQITAIFEQTRRLEEYVQSTGIYNIVGYYSDCDEPGTALKDRQGFNQMIADSERGTFKCILIDGFSKLCSNDSDNMYMFNALNSAHLSLNCYY